MSGTELLSLGVWILMWSIAGALVGAARAYSRVSMAILGVLVGPVIFLALLSRNHQKQCSRCAQWANRPALLCPWCETEFPEGLAQRKKEEYLRRVRTDGRNAPPTP